MKHYDFKICMLGPEKSGKTSLISRYCSNTYGHQDPEPAIEREISVVYDHQEYSVTLKFSEDDREPSNLYIIAVDLRQPQAEVDENIVRFTRKVSFLSAQIPIVLGLCADASVSTLRNCSCRYAEVSSITGAGVEPFLKSISYELLAVEIAAEREEDLFEGGDFKALPHTNVPGVTSDAVAKYCTEHELAEFMLSVVLDACNEKPADFRKWLVLKCKMGPQ